MREGTSFVLFPSVIPSAEHSAWSVWVHGKYLLNEWMSKPPSRLRQSCLPSPFCLYTAQEGHLKPRLEFLNDSSPAHHHPYFQLLDKAFGKVVSRVTTSLENVLSAYEVSSSRWIKMSVGGSLMWPAFRRRPQWLWCTVKSKVPVPPLWDLWLILGANWYVCLPVCLYICFYLSILCQKAWIRRGCWDNQQSYDLNV